LTYLVCSYKYLFVNKRKVAILVSLLAVSASAIGYWAGQPGSGKTDPNPAASPEVPGGTEAMEGDGSMPSTGDAGSLHPQQAGEMMDDEGAYAANPVPQQQQQGAPGMGGPAAGVEPSRAELEFAHNLSGLMEEAYESEDAAREGFAQLETCAGSGTDGKGANSMQERLICLSNARERAETYPDSLGERYNRLELSDKKLSGMLESSGL
jgi:hypothetical protein